MREATLVKTSGISGDAPSFTGIWSDPETTAEVLRVGYDYDAGGAVIELCFWRKPHRYARAVNQILRQNFGADRAIRYRMRPHGREWYLWAPWKDKPYRQLTESGRGATAEWVRVIL